MRKGDGIGMAAVGAALTARLLCLIRRPPWFDEIFTLWISRRAPREILRALRLDSGPPLFYFLEKPLVAAAEAWRLDPTARVLSFLAVGFLFLACASRRTSGGTRFALLLAASPTLFFYSGEARAYGLLSALGFLLFVSTFRARTPRAASIGAALAAALLPWTHYLGVFVVAGSIVLCAARRKFRLVLVQAVAVLPFLLWVPVALAQPRPTIAWSEETFGASLERALGVFSAWAEPAPYFTAFRPPAAVLGALLGAALIAGAAAVARRNRAVRDALVFSALPIFAAAAAALWRPVYFAGRTEMAVLPVALWAFARAARRSRFVRALTAVSIGAGAFAIGAALVAIPPEPSYGATAAAVSAAARPADLVVASDADYLPLRLAADRGALRAPLLGIPEAIEAHPGWFEPGKLDRPASETRRLEGFLGGRPAGTAVFFAVPPDPAPRRVVEPFIEAGSARLLRIPGGDSVLRLEAVPR